MKIKFVCGWDSCENITKRLLYQFKTSDKDLNNIEFVYDDTYELIVYNNFISEEQRPNTSAVIFFHEPTWAGTHQKNFTNNNNLTIYGFDKKLYNQSDKVVECPSHTFYGGRGPWIDDLKYWNYNHLFNKKFIKTKNISSIISTLKNNIADTCTYPIRYNLANELIDKCSFIDFFAGWKGKKNCVDDPRKLAAVESYRFCLAIENEFTKNWITEKFYDSILTNTIPIYYGCKNIKNLYPENAYFLIEDIHDNNKIIELLTYINNNADTLYQKMLPELLKIKNRYFNEYNLLRKINSIESNI